MIIANHDDSDTLQDCFCLCVKRNNKILAMISLHGIGSKGANQFRTLIEDVLGYRGLIVMRVLPPCECLAGIDVVDEGIDMGISLN